MDRVSRIYLPERRRNYRFALTPLADAMFQLLIFFMLSSSLTPYSLLTVQSAPGGTGETSTQAGANPNAAAAPPGAPADVALWSIDEDRVIVGGQVFGMEALDTLADALGASGVPADVVLVVRPGARVQDVTTVLARLRLADVASVQVTPGGT